MKTLFITAWVIILVWKFVYVWLVLLDGEK
jgi:hypothetical protein